MVTPSRVKPAKAGIRSKTGDQTLTETWLFQHHPFRGNLVPVATVGDMFEPRLRPRRRAAETMKG